LLLHVNSFQAIHHDPNAAKAGGLQIHRCQGFAVDDYGGTLGALTLKPSGFCNIGVDNDEKMG
jgi:hypothetical protein